MAIEYINRVAYQDLSVADLELKADVNEGYLIYDIGFTSGGANVIAEVKIDEETYMNIPIHYNYNMLAPLRKKGDNQNMLYQMVRDAYPDVPLISISEGQKLIISTSKQTGKVYVLYRELSGRDIPPEDIEGGKKSKNRLFVSHGKGEVDIPATETKEFKVDTSLNVTGIPQFPFEEGASYKYNWDLLGMCVTKGYNSGTDISVEGIQLWYRERSILAKDREYVDIDLFPYPYNNSQNKIFFFDSPIKFDPEETMSIKVKCKNSNATTTQTARVDVTFLFHQTLR